MTAIKRHIAQQWPRFTVGLYALWGLYGGLRTIWVGLHLDGAFPNLGLLNLHDEPESDPSEPGQIFKKTFVILGSVMVLLNAIKLYAPVRKSIAITKASLVFWGAEAGLLMFGFFLVLFAFGTPGEENDGEKPPQPSVGDWIHSFSNVALCLFNGWALLVFLRDLQHQQRNAWGRLVKTGGVLEYDSVGLLQI